MGTINHAAAIKRLEALFADVNLEKVAPIPEVMVEVEHRHSPKCDVHGGKSLRRGSLGSTLHSTPQKRHSFGSVTSVGPRRESMPSLNLTMPNYYR